ncbi:MAG: hypothetical protein ABF384_10740 [Verrucomicrobiales bacterium]
MSDPKSRSSSISQEPMTRKQLEENMRYWRKLLESVDLELDGEPTRIREFSRVKTTRMEPAASPIDL